MKHIKTFSLRPGDLLSNKYCIVERIGRGWEGEVYRVKEKKTGVERAVKLFFPQRNKRNSNLKFYAKKLHKLRKCTILIQYHTQEDFEWQNQTIPYLVSEYVAGEILSRFKKNQPGKRLTSFQALHFLYALVRGLEEIHVQNEYHGDLHANNIILTRYGLEFELKLIDLFNWNQIARRKNIQDDICDVISVFYEVLGGVRYYKKQPDVIKGIILGKRRSEILKKFRTLRMLREYIEKIQW